MLKSLYLYKVIFNDIVELLNILKLNGIKIFQLNKISSNTFTFYSYIYNKRKIFNLFTNVSIIKKTGMLSIFLSLLKYKTTIIALIISVCFYTSLSNKIWKINVYGDTEVLNSFIIEQLNDNNIYVGSKKIDINKLSQIQNEILYKNYDIIEYLSIKQDGCVIEVNFKKKREITDKNELKGNLYASKDGVIKSFDLLSGEKVVHINDYVKKGDLLVKDVLTTDYNEQVYIGTYGSVYAYTWYYITIEHKIYEYESKETILANTLLEMKRTISINFTDLEYIYEENVLQFNIDNNILKMKVHFTCVEDIAKE